MDETYERASKSSRKWIAYEDELITGLDSESAVPKTGARA
jgi:hypothetical protein